MTAAPGKVRVYNAMHKAQRKRMFDLASAIGRADFSQVETAAQLRKDLQRIVENLRRHAHFEETYVHPLFAELGAEAAAVLRELHEEHVELEPWLEGFEAREPDETLYRDFTRFITLYLAHIDKEEEAQESLLWPHFDNDRLAGVMEASRSHTPPAEAMENLEFMLPCLSVAEATGFLAAAQATAPPEAFQAVCGVAQRVLSPEDWQAVSAKLGV